MSAPLSEVILLPNLLSDLEIDEVSLVGKAAIGKKFLIYKSASKEGVRKMKPRASGKATITKADLNDAVSKAMEAERLKHATEIKALRKEVSVEKTMRRRTQLTELVHKKGLALLGPVDKTVDELLAIEKSDLPKETKKSLVNKMIQAAEIKKQSALFDSLGTSQAAPGTPMAEFDALVEKKLTEIRKSDTGHKDQTVLKALAEDAVSKERPDLARAVMAAERAATLQRQSGVI